MTELITRTGAALGAVLRRRDAGAIVGIASIGYLVIYSYAVGDLSLVADSGFSMLVVDKPLERIFMSRGFSSFEPIALVDAWGLRYLFSPINLVLAVILASLVGANLGITYLGLVQPKACGLEASTGVVAAIPALLSGAACCGPVFLVVVGIQATGLLIAGFQLLVPVAIILLVASLLLVGRNVDPRLV